MDCLRIHTLERNQNEVYQSLQGSLHSESNSTPSLTVSAHARHLAGLPALACMHLHTVSKYLHETLCPNILISETALSEPRSCTRCGKTRACQTEFQLKPAEQSRHNPALYRRQYIDLMSVVGSALLSVLPSRALPSSYMGGARPRGPFRHFEQCWTEPETLQANPCHSV